MIARRSFLTLSASLGATLSLGGCASECGAVCEYGQVSRFTYRYRLSLEIETPEGVASGSGVLEVRAVDAKGIDGRLPMVGTVGEAVVVDLGRRGSLFALLKRDYRRAERSGELSADVTLRVANKDDHKYERYVPLARDIAATEGVIEVLPEELPMLVRFRNIADPATVEKVDPKNLAKSFGAGVRLKRATIEITSDPVTTGIEKRLGWLAMPWKARGALLNGPLWDSDDPGYSYDKRLLIEYFKQGV